MVIADLRLMVMIMVLADVDIHVTVLSMIFMLLMLIFMLIIYVSKLQPELVTSTSLFKQVLQKGKSILGGKGGSGLDVVAYSIVLHA